MKRRLLALSATIIFHAAALGATAFTFTAIPDADETRLQARFQKVADYLAAELGVPVRYLPVRSYAAAVSVFRNDQVQLAWFGGLTGVHARELVPDAEAIAQGVEDREFRSYFIAHRSTGLERGDSLPATLEGMTFTFGAKSSTSGRLMPEYYIRQQLGRSSGDLFSRIGFSGNHSRTIALVQSGAYQLGAVNYRVWESELAAGHIDTDRVRIIWQTPTYPDYHWTVRGDVDARWGEGFKARLTGALLGMDDPQLLRTFPREGFIPADNADYRPIADIARELGLLD